MYLHIPALNSICDRKSDRKTFAVDSVKGGWDIVGGVGKFLSTPVHASGSPVFRKRPIEKDTAGKAFIAFSIIRLLLRMFLKI